MKKVSKKSIVLKKVNCNQSGNTDHDVKFSAEVDFSMTTLLGKYRDHGQWEPFPLSPISRFSFSRRYA